MLLHGNSKTNTNLLAQIIKQAREQGYEFTYWKNIKNNKKLKNN